MPPKASVRRPVTPSVLGLSLLCLLMPFFTVSCSGMMGSLTVSYSGFALAFDGLPSVQGALAEELGEADLEELKAGVQPILLGSVLAVVVGVLATAIVPGPRVRAATGIVVSALALAGVAVNQITMQIGAEERLREQGASEYGLEFTELSVSNGPGFWIMVLVLTGALGWSVAELMMQGKQQGPPGGLPRAGEEPGSRGVQEPRPGPGGTVPPPGGTPGHHGPQGPAPGGS